MYNSVARRVADDACVLLSALSILSCARYSQRKERVQYNSCSSVGMRSEEQRIAEQEWDTSFS